jgi:ATP-dependent Clp protease ATP-binding subunit ClpC
MFERFTERARQVVVLAQEEARTLHHDYIGTEHLVLGLLREEEGLAARVLESFDITVDRAREHVIRIIGTGQEPSSGMIPFTPRAKKALESAQTEALSLGHNYIGTEHILLALTSMDESVGLRILRDLGACAESVRQEVMLPLGGPSALAWPRPRRRAQARVVSVETDVEPPRRAARPPGRDAAALFKACKRTITEVLGREADTGDMLVIVSTLPDGLVARTLAELGVTDQALDAALAKAREAGPDLSDEGLMRVRRRKDEAIEAQEFEKAAKLRDKERVLVGARDVDLFDRVRVRLGLVRPE